MAEKRRSQIRVARKGGEKEQTREKKKEKKKGQEGARRRRRRRREEERRKKGRREGGEEEGEKKKNKNKKRDTHHQARTGTAWIFFACGGPQTLTHAVVARAAAWRLDAVHGGTWLARRTFVVSFVVY